MENKKILSIKHSFMHLKFTNGCYRNQLGSDVNPEDVIYIDVTSRNADPEITHDLSPFFIGPVVASDGKVSKTFENFWQFGKVFEGETKFVEYISRKEKIEHKFICSDKDGNPTPDWFKVREYGYNSTAHYRRPFLGKPLYQYYVNNGKVERLNYIDSRKKVYIPEYCKLVANSKTFKKLKQLVDEGKTIALVDFDGYNFYNKEYMEKRYKADLKKYGHMKYTLEDYLNINTMKDVINFPGLNAGHGFVLKMLLQGDLEVKDGKVIDHSGILD